MTFGPLESPEETKGRKPFSLGNQIWKAAPLCGRGRAFATPEILLEACVEYLQWCEDNPLYEARLVSYKGWSQLVPVPKMRAMTLTALYIFLGCTAAMWEQYRSGIKGEEYVDVILAVENSIRTQKFEGAAADMLNANIIARELRLADVTELSGPRGGAVPVVTKEMTDEEAATLYQIALAMEGGEGV